MTDTKDQDSSLLKNQKKTQKKPQQNRRSLVINIALIGGLFVGAASSGMAIGYSAVLLPQLQSNASAIPIDDNMGSWIASIITGAMPVGSIISAFVVDKLGRTTTLKVQSVMVAVAWIIVACAQNYEIMMLGRFTSGMASGVGMVAAQIYFTEVCKPNIRGIISAGPFISYSIGILVVYALGAVLPWRLVAGLSTITSIISFVVYCVFPESHIWLVKKGRFEKALKSSTWFRANDVEEARKEVNQLISRFEDQKVEETFNYKLFFEPYVLKPFFIALTLNVLQTLSGVYIVVFYATDIVSNIGVEELAISDSLAAVITAVVRMVFTILFSFLLVYMSRRSFVLLSGLSTTVFAVILGTCLYYKLNNYFLPICLAIYVAATVGLLFLPGLMLGELFPIKARGIAGGLSHTLYSISIFGVAKAYPFLKKNLLIHGLFWSFGVSSLLLSIIAYLMLPETRNKTLLEIEDYFLEKNLFWVNRKKKLVCNEEVDQCQKLNNLL